MPIFLLLLTVVSGVPTVALAEELIPQPATIVKTYSGGYKDDYPQVLSRIQAYILSAQSDIATQLGLRVGQGFMHPVSIRFLDGIPVISENPFFSVKIIGAGESFKQDLLVNVEAYAKHRGEISRRENDLRNGFRYALTQAMLNDRAAGDAGSPLPLWAFEGISVYASGDGERIVQDVAGRVFRSNSSELVMELNNPGPFLTPRAWANYYLAVKYIFAQGGVGTLQAFIRDLLDGQSPSDSARNSLGQEWPEFSAGVKAYAASSFARYARTDEDENASPANRTRP